MSGEYDRAVKACADEIGQEFGIRKIEWQKLMKIEAVVKRHFRLVEGSADLTLYQGPEESQVSAEAKPYRGRKKDGRFKSETK